MANEIKLSEDDLGRLLMLEEHGIMLDPSDEQSVRLIAEEQITNYLGNRFEMGAPASVQSVASELLEALQDPEQELCSMGGYVTNFFHEVNELYGLVGEGAEYTAQHGIFIDEAVELQNLKYIRDITMDECPVEELKVSSTSEIQGSSPASPLGPKA